METVPSGPFVSLDKLERSFASSLHCDLATDFVNVLFCFPQCYLFCRCTFFVYYKSVIKFTVEEEKEGSVAFLDTMKTRNPDGTIKTRVYRKATHTDKYLQFNSHHPSQHKRSVARTLLDRAKNIPSTDADRLSEIQHVVNALKINGYTEQFIRSCQSTTVPTNQSQTNRGFVTLPYLQGLSEKIARTLNHFNINVAHKPV